MFEHTAVLKHMAAKGKIYRRVRKVFKEHYACAFRRDLNPEVLDCLVYMAEEIEKYVDENYISKKRLLK